MSKPEYPRKGRGGDFSQFYAKVAREWAEAERQERTHGYALLVAKYGVAPSTARAWIHKARQLGLCPEVPKKCRACGRSL